MLQIVLSVYSWNICWWPTLCYCGPALCWSSGVQSHTRQSPCCRAHCFVGFFFLLDTPLAHVWMLSHFSHIQLFVTPWTITHQAPLSVGFSQQEYWSGLPFPSPGGLPDPGVWVSCLSCIGRRVLYHECLLGSPPPLAQGSASPWPEATQVSHVLWAPGCICSRYPTDTLLSSRLLTFSPALRLGSSSRLGAQLIHRCQRA